MVTHGNFSSTVEKILCHKATAVAILGRRKIDRVIRWLEQRCLNRNARIINKSPHLFLLRGIQAVRILQEFVLPYPGSMQMEWQKFCKFLYVSAPLTQPT
jgi:hypothetical protein